MVSLFWDIIVVVQSLNCVQLLHHHGLQHTRLPCPSLCPGVMSTFKCNVCVFGIRHTHGSYHDCLPNLRGCCGWVFRRGHASNVSETSSLLGESKLLKVNSENLVSEVRKVGASRESSILPSDTGQGHASVPLNDLSTWQRRLSCVWWRKGVQPAGQKGAGLVSRGVCLIQLQHLEMGVTTLIICRRDWDSQKVHNCIRSEDNYMIEMRCRTLHLVPNLLLFIQCHI